MAVYVDNFRGHFGNMVMCHMAADTKEELLEMVRKIGVNPKWIQKEDTWEEHFDICYTKRALAIKNGAIAINMREYAIMINSRPTSPFKHWAEEMKPVVPKTLFD